MSPLRDPAEIPEFSSEEDARAFWDTHEVTEEYLERAGPLPPEALPPAEPGSRSVSVRLDRDVLRRLRALARKKGKAFRPSCGSSWWSGCTRRRSGRDWWGKTKRASRQEARWNVLRGTQAKKTADRPRSLRTVRTPARAVPVRANAPGSATFRGGVHRGSGPAHRK